MSGKERDVATSRSWNDLQPLPDKSVTLALDFQLDAQQAARLRQGFVPVVQEEKWFAYFENGVLYQHRSWTGICIDEVHFITEGEGLRATHAKVNRDPEQYTETDDARDVARIAQMVRDLADLPQGATSGAIVPMAEAISAAAKPNYLGSPEVVHALLLAYVSIVVGAWRYRWDRSEPAVTEDDEEFAMLHLAEVFSGNDLTYVTLPWHSEEDLGRNLVRQMHLIPEILEDPSLWALLIGAVTMFGESVKDVLGRYSHDPQGDWDRDVAPALNRLTHFFETVLLGTNSVHFPGVTMADVT